MYNVTRGLVNSTVMCKKMEQPEINTERLLLRGFLNKDAKRVQELAGNFKVSKATLNIPHPYKDGMAEEWIKTHQKGFEENSQVTFAITNNQTNELIGAISLIAIKEKQAEIGYWIGEPFWGKGYCTEATKALINYSFTKRGLIKLVADHLSSNPASGKVMKKAGMYHVASKQMKDRFSNVVDAETYEIQNT